MKSHLFFIFLFLCGFATGLFGSAGVFVYGEYNGKRTFLLARRSGRCWENLSGRFDHDTDADGRATAMREAKEETAGILNIDRRKLEDFDRVYTHEIFSYDSAGVYLNPSLMKASRRRMEKELKDCKDALASEKSTVERTNLKHLCKLREAAIRHIENDDWHWFTLDQIKDLHREGKLCDKTDDYLFGPAKAFGKLGSL